MDIKEKSKKEESLNDSFVRTMRTDIKALQRGGVVSKQATPPEKLPVVESIKEETKPAKPEPKPEPKPKPIPILAVPIKKTKRTSFRFAWISLIVILIIGGIGGFFYWWNYSNPVPPAPTYSVCQDFQCVVVEGEGADQCQLDTDCEPVEPPIPTPLISVDNIELVELNAEEEDTLFYELKILAGQEQVDQSLNQILVKSVSPTEKKYFDLDTLASNLGLTIPETIQASEYTLFLYSQAEGNRLGLVMEIESPTSTEDLRSWEESMAADLISFHLSNREDMPVTEEFQDNVYQETVIRYLNFPDPGLSIDYAIIENNLIITTSKESMYAVIDRILAEANQEE